MAMGLQHYPPSVSDVPRGLTAPSPLYRLYGMLLLASLFLFLLIYLALVAGAAYLVYLAITYPIGRFGTGPLILKLGTIGMSVMLFLFLVKGLFKRHRTDLSELTEVTEGEQPELYAFIRRLCRELKAPFPSRIFLDPGVNAAVIYDTSLLSLVIPPRKHLLIGLGLVNVVNMSEFKAVLAHEFGHFTQSSLAAYVAIVNQVIVDLVWARDGFDDALEDWKELTCASRSSSSSSPACCGCSASSWRACSA